MDWRLILLFIALAKSQNLFNIEDSGENENLENPPCSMDYFDDDSSKSCHHDNFPTQTLQDLLGPRVKLCCDAHGYIFEENCDVSFSSHFNFN